MHPVRIWDLPTRVFHWLLALSVFGLIVTGTLGGSWMNWHMRLGYAVLALLLFRLVWGLIGGHWSRFASFLYGPGALMRYLRGQSPADHSAGHSPLGALSVFALLFILLAQVGTGLISDDEIATFGPLVRFVSGETVAAATGYHKEVGKLLILGLVVLHIAAIVVYRLVKRQALTRAMLTGDKQLPAPVPASRDTLGTRLLALSVLLASGAVVWWLVRLGQVTY
ncbi:cytochrome b/b6 domain-containing protein [Hydrogenophaga crocea]|uniref:Cytochrome B n=1 Tax=Hydrogenophaga crocea TaxID=2716225 RepID=A0A6G8IKL3_9BURK|nr:cytochrome b/b6 domain-containing protein [Hydrogenophaga crocea]QIM53555.1 cytochrome B [Hydrogenophaga crocea]